MTDDIYPCVCCGDPLDWAGDDAVWSETFGTLVHRDCLIDSGEVA